MHIRYGIHSVCAQTPIRSSVRRRQASLVQREVPSDCEAEGLSPCPQTGFSEIPLKRGNGQLFSLPKRKKLAKKKLATLQVDRVAPINCPVRSFSASKGAVPQMAVLPTPEFKRLESIGSRTGGFDVMGAVRVRSYHANHGTQTVWVCVPRFVGSWIKWMQRCADGALPPPLGDLFPPCAGA